LVSLCVVAGLAPEQYASDIAVPSERTHDTDRVDVTVPQPFGVLQPPVLQE
jgi:hypothetical protein